MLQELEPINDITLVCRKEKSATMQCPIFDLFGLGNFTSKGNTSPHNATRCCGVRIEVFEVSSGVSLADVRSERASILGRLVVGKGEAEVVISIWVRPKCWVVVRWRNINWCS